MLVYWEYFFLKVYDNRAQVVPKLCAFLIIVTSRTVIGQSYCSRNSTSVHCFLPKHDMCSAGYQLMLSVFLLPAVLTRLVAIRYGPAFKQH